MRFKFFVRRRFPNHSERCPQGRFTPHPVQMESRTNELYICASRCHGMVVGGGSFPLNWTSHHDRMWVGAVAPTSWRSRQSM